MRFADLDLARRLEYASASASVSPSRDGDQTGDERKCVSEPIGGGVAVFAGIGSPVTQAQAMGLNGPVPETEIDRLEKFFQTRGSAVIVELCPLADPAFVEALGRRGYRMLEFSNVLFRELRSGEKFSSNFPGIEIAQAGEQERDAWARTVAEGFAEYFPVTEEMLATIKEFLGGLETRCYLARIDGATAGGGVVSLRDGVAGLFGASTLPAYRRRGIQSALLTVRLNAATEAGCDLAMSIPQPGSGSQRNLERFGFRVAYTRAKVIREWPARDDGNRADS
jgi:GNAT superfamily N-acetyltransferase